MRNLNKEERRNELRKLLVRLSGSKDCFRNNKQLENCIESLEEIYWISKDEKFRHFYSDIFATVSLIDADASLGDINTLVDNIEFIQNEYIDKNYDDAGEKIDIRKEIEKLYDHVNLDVARLNYLAQTFSKTESSLAELKEDGRKAKEGIRRAENAEKNYITILGIFASIVLAFTAGLAFSTSVLENIHLASPCRLAFVVEILAFTFINVIYILTWFIQKINSNGEVKYPCFMKVINLIIVVSAVITAKCWW